MTTTINDLQKYTLAVTAANAVGVLVPLKSSPIWATSDDTVATVLVASDGLTAEISSTGKSGVATITVTADGLTATDDVTVIASPAVALTLVASPAVSRI